MWEKNVRIGASSRWSIVDGIWLKNKYKYVGINEGLKDKDVGKNG